MALDELTDKGATGGGSRLEPKQQQTLLTVIYTRGIEFTSKAMDMSEETIMRSLKGETLPDVEIKKINHWLQERVS